LGIHRFEQLGRKSVAESPVRMVNTPSTIKLSSQAQPEKV
jgi:hypothetical protein